MGAFVAAHLFNVVGEAISNRLHGCIERSSSGEHARDTVPRPGQILKRLIKPGTAF